MRRQREGPNEEVAAIVNEVLGPMSLGQAEIHLNYRLSKEAIRSLKAGRVGWESTIRAFAEGFAARISELYAAEITQLFGKCDAGAVSDWLAEKAGFRKPGAAAPEGGLPTGKALEDLLTRAAEAGARAVLASRVQEAGATYDATYAREMRRVREQLAADGILDLPEEMGHQGGTRNLTPEHAIEEARDFERMVRELHGKSKS